MTWRKYGMYKCIHFFKQFFENVLSSVAGLVAR